MGSKYGPLSWVLSLFFRAVFKYAALLVCYVTVYIDGAEGSILRA